MLACFISSSQNCSVVESTYLQKYPERRQPNKRTYSKFETNLKAYGSFKKPVVSRYKSSNEEAVLNVLLAVTEGPGTSVWWIERKEEVEVFDPSASKQNSKPNEKIFVITVPETATPRVYRKTSPRTPSTKKTTTERLHEGDYEEVTASNFNEMLSEMTTKAFISSQKPLETSLENDTETDIREVTTEGIEEGEHTSEFDGSQNNLTESSTALNEPYSSLSYYGFTGEDTEPKAAINNGSEIIEYSRDTTTEEDNTFITQDNYQNSTRYENLDFTDISTTTEEASIFSRDDYELNTKSGSENITNITTHADDDYFYSETIWDSIMRNNSYDESITETIPFGDVTFGDKTNDYEEEEMLTTENFYSTWDVFTWVSNQKYREQEEMIRNNTEEFTGFTDSTESSNEIFKKSRITELNGYDDDTDADEFSTETSRNINFTFGMTDPICTSAQCKLVDSEMLSHMNHNAIPCDDFYEFACGNWRGLKQQLNYDLLRKINDNSHPSDSYLGKFREFYQSCIKYEDHFNYTERIEKLKALSSEIGTFQLDDSVDDEKMVDIFTKLTLLQSNIFFDIGLTIDAESSKYILQLTLPSGSTLKNTLNGWTYSEEAHNFCIEQAKSGISGAVITFKNLSLLYNTHEDYGSCLLKYNWHRYTDSVQYVLQELNIFSGEQSVQQYEEIRHTINSLIGLTISNEVPSPDKIRNSITRRDFKKINILDLETNYPLLKWKSFLDKIVGRPVSNDATLEVYFDKYFQILIKEILKGTPITKAITKKNMYNALLAIIIHNLYENTIISKEKSNRVSYCLRLSQGLMPDVSNSLLKAVYQESDMITNRLFLKNIYENLNDTLAKALNAEDWLDQKSKEMVLDKLYRLKPIFSTNYISSKEEDRLKSTYNNFTVKQNEFQKNLLEALQKYRRSIYALTGKPANSEDLFDYFVPLDSEYPVSLYESNLIIIPNGFLLKAYEDIPSYVALARSGFHLAKEILKHFDPTGVNIGLKVSQQFLQTYSQLETSTYLPNEDYKKDTYKFNSTLSLIDRISDNAAMKLVVNTLNLKANADLLPWISNSYSREKVFYIAIAQEFCKEQSVFDFMLQVYESEKLPEKLRIEGIMFNSDEFARSFDCPPGSGLYNELEKVIFPYLKSDYTYNYDDKSYSYNYEESPNT